MNYFVEPGTELVILFPFTTGLAPSSTLSKNGAAFVATTNSAVEISNGYYQLTLTSAELAAQGTYLLRVFFAAQPDYSAMIQVTPLTSVIEKSTNSALTKQTSEIAKSTDNSVSILRKGLKQFIATENLTTRAVRNRNAR